MEWTCKYCESINEGNKCFYCGAPREKIVNNKIASQHDLLEIIETSYHLYGDNFDVTLLRNADGTIRENSNSDEIIKENKNELQESKNSNSDHRWHRIQEWFSRHK